MSDGKDSASDLYEELEALRARIRELEALERIVAERTADLEKEVAERREAEAALLREKYLSDSIINSLPGLFYLFDENGRLERWNRNLELLSGYSSEEIGAMRAVDFVVPEDRTTAADAIGQVFIKGRSSTEARLMGKDGSSSTFLFTGQLVSIGDRQYLSGMALDIGEQKGTEELIRLNESRLNSLLELSQKAHTLSEQEIVRYALEEAVRLTGSRIGYFHFLNEDQETIELVSWSRNALMNCRAPYEKHYPLSAAGVWADCARTGRPAVHNDFPSLAGRRGLPDGHSQIVRHMSVPVIENGKVRVITGVGNKDCDYEESDVRQLQLLANDVWKIVQRKRAEESLMKNEQRLAYALRAANAGAWEWDMKTNCAIWSEGNYRVLGLVPGSAPSCYETWLRCVHPDDRDETERHVRETVEQRKDLDIIFRVVWPDGTIHWLNDIGSMMFDETGDPAGMYGIQIDITERKHAEARQESLAGILENSLNEIYMFDAETLRLVFANRSARENLGYSLEELQCLTMADLETDVGHESFIALLQPLISGAKAKIELITTHRRKDGSLYPVEVHLQPGVYESRRVFAAFILDISERRRMERDLRQSLREKETLLKEIHHRVKNNLQVISSLLDLQARYIKDRKALDVFRESERRVRSMALIHDRLYSARDTARIEFSQYVDSLMTYLFQSFSTETRSVAWSADIPELFLGLDTAVPCGLIINELVMNCLKHAFPDGRPGHVKVRIDADEDGKLTLYVADDGVGFPPGFDPGQTDSLGLTIVRTLVRQLRGAMDIRHAGPAEITITFRESRGEGG